MIACAPRGMAYTPFSLCQRCEWVEPLAAVGHHRTASLDACGSIGGHACKKRLGQVFSWCSCSDHSSAFDFTKHQWFNVHLPTIETNTESAQLLSCHVRAATRVLRARRDSHACRMLGTQFVPPPSRRASHDIAAHSRDLLAVHHCSCEKLPRCGALLCNIAWWTLVRCRCCLANTLQQCKFWILTATRTHINLLSLGRRCLSEQKIAVLWIHHDPSRYWSHHTTLRVTCPKLLVTPPELTGHTLAHG